MTWNVRSALYFRIWGQSVGILKGSTYLSWRQMYIERPRVCFNGCYISKTSYLRYGERSFQVRIWRRNNLLWNRNFRTMVHHYFYVFSGKIGSILSSGAFDRILSLCAIFPRWNCFSDDKHRWTGPSCWKTAERQKSPRCAQRKLQVMHPKKNYFQPTKLSLSFF